MSKKIDDLAEKVFFFLASNLVGLAFILMGVLATISINEKTADICNIWSLFYVFGLWIASYVDLYGKITRKFTPKNANRHRSGWKFTIEFSWMIASILPAYAISNWIWDGNEPQILEFTTNGCALFVMGITSFMLYLNYSE